MGPWWTVVAAVSVALLDQRVYSGPVPQKDKLVVRHDAVGQNAGLTDLDEFYMQKYQEEEAKGDASPLFDDTGDDVSLKEYYDYVDHMDEEERTDILDMLHQEDEEGEDRKNGLGKKGQRTRMHTADATETHRAEVTSAAAADVHTIQDAQMTISRAFQPIPLPSQFDQYDVIRRDGVITLGELALVTGAHENIKQAFQESDSNGDGVLNEDEFHNAPWYRMSEASDAHHNGIVEDTTLPGAGN